MERIYKHTQVGWAVIAAFAAAAVYAALVLRSPDDRPWVLAIVPLAVIILAFSTLTVEVTGDEVRWRFGPGVRGRRMALSRIAAVEVVRNPWYYGWGIRITPHGVLYNVSGTGAVEMRLKTGTNFRLGSDEPERLRDAILAALRRAG